MVSRIGSTVLPAAVGVSRLHPTISLVVPRGNRDAEEIQDRVRVPAVVAQMGGNGVLPGLAQHTQPSLGYMCRLSRARHGVGQSASPSVGTSGIADTADRRNRECLEH